MTTPRSMSEIRSNFYTDRRVSSRETPAGAQQKADDALAKARAYTLSQAAVDLGPHYIYRDELNIALDTDGVPYYSAAGVPTADGVLVLLDTDGHLYWAYPNETL